MLANLKKMLVFVPCMILGLFLLNNASVSAADAKLLDANKVVIGEENRENTYYFTNSRAWEFRADFNVVADWDTYVTYRVITPDGRATAESDKINYVNTGGKFSISDITALNYSETVDVSARSSVAPAGTYYVDIKYYGAYLFVKWDQKKDETIKIVLGDDGTLSLPTINIAYDSATNKYKVDASVMKGDKGYSVITNVDFYFSMDAVDNQVSTFYTNLASAEDKAKLAISVPTSATSHEISGVEGKQYKHLYVMVTTANGYSKIAAYDMETGTDNVVDEDKKTELGDEDGSGLFDYDFGELILLVLVVVLIVSCALIITQKIVDYKKRLY